MKTSILFKVAAIVLVVVVANSCFNSRPRVQKPNPSFSKHISGFTFGMISRQSSIKIELAHDIYSKFDNKGKLIPIKTKNQNNPILDSTLLNGIFEFNPAIKGKAIWVSKTTIEFVPDELLPSDVFYNASFKLKNIMDVEDELEYFDFQFSTYKQEADVNIEGLNNYDSYNVEWQYLEGRIQFSDEVDSAEVVSIIDAKLDGRKVKMDFEKSYYNDKIYRFRIDSIERKTIARMLKISWDAGILNSTDKGSSDFEIKALGDFTISNINVVDDGDQYIELYFTDPIYYNQDLKGLVQIQGFNGELKFSIIQNMIKVFLPEYKPGVRNIIISPGIKNFKGYKMLKGFQEQVFFEEPKPRVRLKSEGSILPNSQGLIFPFDAISLTAVDVRIMKIYMNNTHQFFQSNEIDGSSELYRVGKIIKEVKVKLDYDKKKNLKTWNTFVIDLNKLISVDPGAIYRVSIKFNKEYAICDCDQEADENEDGDGVVVQDPVEIEDEDEEWRDDFYSSFDDDYDYWYDYNEQSSPCNSSYYHGKSVSKNILASDIGLIYKLDYDKLSHAFTTNLITSKPQPGVLIQFFDFTNQLIASGISDNHGMLSVKLKSKPFLMVAKYGKQRGYLKLTDNNTNSMSKFEVEGDQVKKGIKGFIYAERGVWRPGDSIYLNFILEDKLDKLPDNHPVKMQLVNPDGAVIYNVVKTRSVNGLYDFRTTTSADARTGNYQARVIVGNQTYSKYLKIETVKPNRLKINLDFDKKDGDSISTLTAKWLHGAAAKNLRATTEVSFYQTNTSFERLKSYSFDSPIRKYNSNRELIYDGNLDINGQAKVKTKLIFGNQAPGSLNAVYNTRVFEQGGDYSVDRFTRKIMVYKRYVGIKAPTSKKYGNTLENGKSHRFELVSVDKNGTNIDKARINVKIYKIQWRWWYERNEENFADYIARNGSIVVFDSLVVTEDGKGHFNFKVNYPEYGRYLVVAQDVYGGHQSGVVFSIDYPYWNRDNGGNKENVTMLNISTDKPKYNKGEKIKLTIPTLSNGTALISVENGRQVLKKFWINTSDVETRYEMVATADMTPNAYIHITLLQPHLNTKNDLPIRMYGVVPVMVEDPASRLDPIIKVPEVVKPETMINIGVSERNGKKMTYTLALVDDGLLDLTRFSTPEPWSNFYSKEALGVKTWDMFDDVIGAFAGKFDRLLAIGGDGEGNAGKNLKANRFKPMVIFAGPFTIENGKGRVHKVKLPNYIGSARVMVVAENDGSYGNSEKTITIKKPLMVLATLPRVIGPGETFSIPVNVFAMEKHVKKVAITVESSDNVKLMDEKSKDIEFETIGDEIVNFRFKTALKVGVAKFKIRASGGGEVAVTEVEIEIRPSNPKVVDVVNFAIEPGKSITANAVFNGIEGTNKAVVEMSNIPSLGLEKRLNYLITYPYGCIEQTTSSVFPQIFLAKIMKLNEKQKIGVEVNVKSALRRLVRFQTSNGGFAYWPGESFESEWGTNYAGHFMLEAEAIGYKLPTNLKEKWIFYQKGMARNWSKKEGRHETSSNIQAYRLLTLAIAKSPEIGAMNRLLEEKDLDNVSKWMLASAYKRVGMDEVANKLASNLQVSVKDYKELSFTYGSGLRDKAIILQSMSIIGMKTQAGHLAREIAKTLGNDAWLNTQETAYSLLAICEYAGLNTEYSGLNFSYSLENGKSNTPKKVQTSKSVEMITFGEGDFKKSGLVNIKNDGNTTLFVKVAVEGIPLVGDKSVKANHMSMIIDYLDLNGNIIKPDSLKQGADFMARVTIKNIGGRGYLREVALNQIFAAGWEIRSDRVDNNFDGVATRYQDIRDDRVYSFFDLAEGQTKTINIYLNASYLGNFYLPTVYAEAMYDNSISARVPGRWVKVIK